MKMKIAILGYYGHKNAGDEAFKIVFELFLACHELHFFSPNDLPYYENQFDLLILGGGNVLGEYFLSPLFSRGWSECKKYAVGVGLSDEKGVYLAKEAGFNKIFVRNHSELSKLSICSEINFIPDIVFSLMSKSNQTKTTALMPIINPSYDKGKSIAFVVSLEYFPEFNRVRREHAYREFDQSIKILSETISLLQLKFNISLIVISSDIYHYDEIYARLLFRACEHAWKNVSIVNCNGNPDMSIAFFKGHECILSMKYHGLIFSMINSIPAINISANIKNKDLMDYAGLSKFSVDILDKKLKATELSAIIDDSIKEASLYHRISEQFSINVEKQLSQFSYKLNQDSNII